MIPTVPYPWAEHATLIGYDEPGHTIIPTSLGYDIDTTDGHQPMFLEGLWARCYPSDRAQEQ